MIRVGIIRTILFIIVVLKNFMCNTNGLTVKDQKTVQIIEGGNINILCDITGHQGQHIFWESEDELFHVDGNQLLLQAVTRNQAGSYGCYSRSEESNALIEEVLIDVLYPTTILSWDTPYRRLEQNDSYNTVVEIQGNPPPDRIFLISNQTEKILFRSEGDGKINISIKSVQCGDTGTYQLHAINDINSDFLTKSIIVYCEPYVNPDMTTRFDMMPRLGETIVLEMHAAGYPQPNFTWSYEGSQLDHKDDGYTSTVHLDDIDVDDFGTYRLDMENSVGKTSYFFRVIPSGPPEPPSNLTFLKSTSYSATLSWTPGYDYNSTQTFIIEDSENNVLHEFTEDSNEVWNVTIRTINYLMPEHFYNITIFARNKNGTSKECQHRVSFYTQESTTSWAIILGVVSSPFVIVLLYSVAFKYMYKNKNPTVRDDATERKSLLAESTKHRYSENDQVDDNPQYNKENGKKYHSCT